MIIRGEGKAIFTYYLCDDNDTIYNLKMSIKQKDKDYYLSLLKNYLKELVKVNEKVEKKLIKEEKILEKIKENVSLKESVIFLEKSEITNIEKIEKIENYLPSIVTIKTKKYLMPHSYTIYILIKLLANDLEKTTNPLISKIIGLLNYSRYIDFNHIYKTFFDEDGKIISEKEEDYNSLSSLLKNLEIKIDLVYSYNHLSSFWQGDDMERETAEGIVNDSQKNKEALQKLNLTLIKHFSLSNLTS